MGKHRDLDTGNALPASWTDGIQEFISTITQAQVVRVDNTTLKVPAGAGAGLKALGFGGPWRYNVADATAAHPGGGAGVYDVLAVASANSFENPPNPGQTDVDDTDYTFGLKITVHDVAATGSYNGNPITLQRKLAEIDWDGAAIAKIRPVDGVRESAGDFTVGGQLIIPTPGAVAGIVLGLDTNIYRDNPNVLRTDDSLDIGGDLRHRTAAANLGFFGATPAPRNTGWGAALATNFPGAVSRKSLTSSYTEDNLRDLVATLIDVLRSYGLLGA